MAFSHGSKAKVLANGYDISGYTKNAGFSGSLDTAESSVMGNTAKQYVTGLADASLSLEGVFDGAPGAADEIFASIFAGTSDGILYCPAGYSTLGQPAWGFDAMNSSYEVGTDVGDAASWSAAFQSNMGFERGLLSHVFQAEVAGGNTTGLDYGSTSSLNGGVIYLQATAAASLAVKLQDSADNSTFADVAGAVFSTVSARSYQRVAFTGTVRRYTRILWTGTGTFAASFVRK